MENIKIKSININNTESVSSLNEIAKQVNMQNMNAYVRQIHNIQNKAELTNAFIFWSNFYLSCGITEVNLILGFILQQMTAEKQRECFESLSENQKLFLLENGIKFNEGYSFEDACKSTDAYKNFVFQIENNVAGMNDPKVQRKIWSHLPLGARIATLPLLKEKGNAPSSGCELAKGFFAITGLGLLTAACFVSDLFVSCVSGPATSFIKNIINAMPAVASEIIVGFTASAIFYKLEEGGLSGLTNQQFTTNHKACKLSKNQKGIELENSNENAQQNEVENENTHLLAENDQQPLTQTIDYNFIEDSLIQFENTKNLVLPDDTSTAWLQFQKLSNKKNKNDDNNKVNIFELMKNNDNNFDKDNYNKFYNSVSFNALLDEARRISGTNNIQDTLCCTFVFLINYVHGSSNFNDINEILCGLLELMNEENQAKYFLNLSEDMQIILLNLGANLYPETLRQASEKSLIAIQFANRIKVENMQDDPKRQLEAWNKLSLGERILTYTALSENAKPKVSLCGMQSRRFATKALAAVCFCSGILTAVLVPVIPISAAITGLLFSVLFSSLELLNIVVIEPRVEKYCQNYTITNKFNTAKQKAENQITDKSLTSNLMPILVQ
jgi:hypothetical protein